MKDEGPLSAGTVFTLRCRILAHDVPGVLRVRRMLKAMLREYGIRNEGFCPDAPPDAANGTPDAGKGMS